MEHSKRMNEIYLQHLKEALRVGLRMIITGAACLIHAIFPFIFQITASTCIFELEKST